MPWRHPGDGHARSHQGYISQGGPSENHNRWAHIGIGAGITGGLGVLRLRFASWPLHPVGYLLVYHLPDAEDLVQHHGRLAGKGAGGEVWRRVLYRAVQPLFMGLIIGEVGAAAFWLMVSLVLNAMGMQYNADQPAAHVEEAADDRCVARLATGGA